MIELTFKVGDLVTAYWKGLYEVVDIERRWENKTKDTKHGRHSYAIRRTHTDECGDEISPLIYLKQRYNGVGEEIKGKVTRYCDAHFCQLASTFIENETARLISIIDNYNSIK